MEEIVIPYTPRDAFLPFHNRTQRWSNVVAHRRCGKTVAHVNDAVKRAIEESKPDGRYAYIAPFRQQAKDAAWEYLKRYTQQIVLSASDVRESDLSVRIMGGPIVRLYGADNPNSMRGPYLDGAVMDEYAYMRPSLWGEVIRPMLADRHGWGSFIGTPNGHDAFYELHRKAQANPAEWFTAVLPASRTGILPQPEIEDMRKDMTADQFEQELECSFEAAILGAVYAKELKAAQDRVRSVPYDGSRLVYTAFDIGKRDATAIWFYQIFGGEIRFIDYFEDSGESAPYYASILRSRAYNYDTLYLPHDANNESIVSDVTFAGVMRANGFKVEVLENKVSLEDGINAARMLFPQCQFDKERCRAGLESLGNYRWDYNKRMGEMKSQPVHDWSSHGADAFRYAALSIRGGKEAPQRQKWKPINYPKRG